MKLKTGKWIILVGILICLLAGLVFLTMLKPEGSEIQAEFTTMTEGKITPRKLTEAKLFLDKNIKRLDEEYASHILVAYEDYALRFINTEADMTLVQQLVSVYDKEKGQVNEEKLVSEELQELYESMQTAEIHLGIIRDTAELSLDYGALEEQYGKYVCKALSQMYKIKAREEQEPCIENATLLISWGDLAQRAYDVERLIQEYGTEHLITEDGRWMLETYVNFMLMGANNSPVFDYETTEFKTEAKVQYELFTEEHPDSAITWMLLQYFDYLEENDYTMNYKDSEASKKFFDMCSWLVTETEKRVYKQ